MFKPYEIKNFTEEWHGYTLQCTSKNDYRYYFELSVTLEIDEHRFKVCDRRYNGCNHNGQLKICKGKLIEKILYIANGDQLKEIKEELNNVIDKYEKSIKHATNLMEAAKVIKEDIKL